MKREWKRRALPTKTVENDNHDELQTSCNSGSSLGHNADNERTLHRRDGAEIGEAVGPTNPVSTSAITASGQEGHRSQADIIEQPRLPTPTPPPPQHHIEREGPKHEKVEQQQQQKQNARRKLKRTQVDVELRLQEAIERKADTLYLTNYSLHQFDSPFLPRVSERTVSSRP